MHCLSFLVTKVLYSPQFPLTSDDDITEYSFVGICLRFFAVSNIYCVLGGTDCKLLKTPNYESETEWLRQSLK
jgi:hypothetical protein